MDADALKEWAGHYLRSRDAYHKLITSIEDTSHGCLVHYKDSDVQVKVTAHLKDLKPEEIRESQIIITPNKRGNVEDLIKRWNTYKEISVKIYFINPKSHSEKKWILNPFVHAKICEASSLKKGLMALFASVDPVV